MNPETRNSKRPKQGRLFTLPDPLTERFGSAFFRALPASPGVYFMKDREGKIIYIGQSSDLKARLGSYRHVTPETHPRRTLRMVRHVALIEWQVCQTAEEAIALESALLLEHRPPFNRAGVWKGDPWWLRVEIVGDHLELELTREERGHGPLPSAFRHVLGSLVRCLHRLTFPDLPVSSYPLGLWSGRPPLQYRLTLPDTPETAHLLTTYATHYPEPLLTKLTALNPGTTEAEQELWTEELNRLTKFAAKMNKAATPS